MKPTSNNNQPTILHWPSTPLGQLWGALNAHNQLTQLHWGAPPSHCLITTNNPLHQTLLNYLMFAHVTGVTPGRGGVNSRSIRELGPPPEPGVTQYSVLPKYIAPQGTLFQQRVWQALLKIPYGHTQTYGQLAKTLNSSPRAVGGAVGRNPIPILIPCHRVMGQGGQLTGFSAPGGLQTKQWLLQHEGITWAKAA